MKNHATVLLFLFLQFSNCTSFYSRLTNLLTVARDATDTYFNRRHYFEAENVVEEETSIGEYDFIIIGSGSSGAVLANRLSENPNWNVLLLEAGKRANPFTQIPLLAPVFQVTPYNWNYTMEKQEGFCLAMEDQKCAWPRGKALGGTTVINYMIYTRGNPLDFEKWRKEGNVGWSYEEVLPYYLKSENCQLGEECNTQYHHQGGYLTIERPYSSPLSTAFIQAGKQLGYKQVDYNSPDYLGFSVIQATMKHGRRVSSATAFLDPISHRPNLHILTVARVTKILIDEHTKEAYGVEFFRRKRKFSVRASREVISSAGAFHSPQLLMISGVGPKEELERHNIRLIHDSPVGKTLYDHITFMGFVVKINQTIEPREIVFDPSVTFDWLFKGQGFLSSLGGVEALSYIDTTNNGSYPDIELILSGIGSLEWDRGLISRPELRFKQEFYDEYYKPLENSSSFAVLPMLLHPKSAGYVKLDSSNPFDAPLLFGNYLTDVDGKDLKTLIRSVRLLQKLIETDAFKKYDAKLYDKHVPGCEARSYDTDAYWECAIRHTGVTLHHQIATCKMGGRTDETAVVDPKGKVYGIKKLRVVDSSIIPVTLSAHTSAPSMMIGEKIADNIKNEHDS